MARIVFVSSAEKGHLHPLLGTAQQLIARGHQVGWLGLPAAPAFLRDFGIEPLALPASALGPGIVKGGIELSALVRDAVALRRWIRGLLIDAVPAQVEPVRGVFEAFRADAVATDPMAYQSILAAHAARLPWVCLSTSLNPVTPDDWDEELTRTARGLHAERDAMFRAAGLTLRFKVCDALSPFGTACFSSKAHVGEVEVPEGVELVGPTRPLGSRGDDVADFPWSRLDGRPLAYLSFGSQIAWQPEAFRRAAAACAQAGMQLVINVGRGNPLPAEGELPGAPLCVNYAPQLALLERAAVLLTHGGANSVMEALCAGVPLVVSPVCNDQPLQARFLAARGLALQLDLDTVPVEQLAEGLKALLQPDSKVRAAVQQVAKLHAEMDGASRAADMVERALR